MVATARRVFRHNNGMSQCGSAALVRLSDLSGALPTLSIFFAFSAFFRGYSFFLRTPAPIGTSAFNQFAKLSFTDSGVISAIRLV